MAGHHLPRPDSTWLRAAPHPNASSPDPGVPARPTPPRPSLPLPARSFTPAQVVDVCSVLHEAGLLSAPTLLRLQRHLEEAAPPPDSTPASNVKPWADAATACRLMAAVTAAVRADAAAAGAAPGSGADAGRGIALCLARCIAPHAAEVAPGQLVSALAGAHEMMVPRSGGGGGEAGQTWEALQHASAAALEPRLKE